MVMKSEMDNREKIEAQVFGLDFTKICLLKLQQTVHFILSFG